MLAPYKTGFIYRFVSSMLSILLALIIVAQTSENLPVSQEHRGGWIACDIVTLHGSRGLRLRGGGVLPELW